MVHHKQMTGNYPKASSEEKVQLTYNHLSCKHIISNRSGQISSDFMFIILIIILCVLVIFQN